MDYHGVNRHRVLDCYSQPDWGCAVKEFYQAISTLIECCGEKKAKAIIEQELCEQAEQIVRLSLDDFTACNIGQITINAITNGILDAAEWEETLYRDREKMYG